MFDISILENLLDEARKRDLKYDWTDELENYKDRGNTYVHFSKGISSEGKYGKPSFHKNEPKIGLNPQQHWISTPMGLYAYPLDEMMYDIFKAKSRMFATDFPFVYFIEANKDVKHIKDLYTMPREDVLEYVDKLKSSYPEYKDEIGLETEDGSGFWGLIKKFAQTLNKGNSGSRSDQSYITKFASVLYKTLGVEWVGDTDGNIHPNEPHQAVFFTKRSYKVLKMVENQTAKKSLYGTTDGVDNVRAVLNKLPLIKYVNFSIEHPELINKIVNFAHYRATTSSQIGKEKDWIELTRHPELFEKFLNSSSFRDAIKYVPDDSELLNGYVLGDNIKFLNDISDTKFDKIMSYSENVGIVKNDIVWLFLKRSEYASPLIKTQEDFEEAVDRFLRITYANQYESDMFTLQDNFIDYCKTVRTKFVLNVADYYKERMKDFAPYKRLVNVFEKIDVYKGLYKNEDGSYSFGGSDIVLDKYLDEYGKLVAPITDVFWATSTGSQLSSLEGLPDDIHTIKLTDCTQLHNLKGCPNKIGLLSIDNCGLRSLDGISKDIGKLEIKNCRLLRDVRELDKLNPSCEIILSKNRPIELNTQLDSKLINKINLTEKNTFHYWNSKYQ